MGFKTIRTFTLLSLLLLAGITRPAVAQTFDEARKLAFSGDHAGARLACHAILKKGYDPDVAILLARTYAWDGIRDSSRLVLEEVLNRYPDHLDALDAFADVEYWSDNYGKAIEYCDRALRKEPGSGDFLLKKARILHSNGKFDEAVDNLETLVEKDPGYPDALKKLQEFRLDVMKNTIRLNYTLDLFDPAFNRDPWQIAALSYGRKTRLGTVIARFNAASRFGETGFQGELDAYPRISENNYGYLNYGYSASSIFPLHRAGLEWYHNFPKSFEGSIGMRFLYFGDTGVNIYTGTLGKYTGNWWFSIRSFVTPGSSGTSVSGFLQARRYFSDPENYLGLRLGYGVSPDDHRNLIDSDSQLALRTRSVRGEFNHLFSRRWILNAGIVWGNEELPAESDKVFKGYYTFDISISRLF